MSNASALASLANFSAGLRRLPLVVAQKVATRCAPVLTSLVRETFDASENAYGNLWEPGYDGRRVTLRKSGALARGLAYVAIGTRLRMKLSASHAKYQVSRRPVAPFQGAPLPVAYSKALSDTAAEVIREELGR